MTSIYERALGADFVRLHPRVQERFGFSSRDGVACIGHGRMDEIWRGRPYTVPFLVLGTWRRIMFPSYGLDIPFTIENYAYVDSFGRETMTWIRTFEFPQRVRRFDATMIWSDARGCIVDYLGTHQHLAVDIHPSVSDIGGMRIRSGAQRFYERRIAFAFPMALSGGAEVHEWWDDEAERYCIDVAVTNVRWGRLFGYRGSFSVEWKPCDAAAVPAHVKPRREERRE